MSKIDVASLSKLSRQQVFDKGDWSNEMVEYMIYEGILRNISGTILPAFDIKYNKNKFPLIVRNPIKICECGLQLMIDGTCEQCNYWDNEYSCEYFATMTKNKY